MIPSRIAADADAERILAIAEQWKIDCNLAVRLHRMAAELPFSIQIFSGYRTPDQQRNAGPTAAPVDRSTHTSCPATGADVQPMAIVRTRAVIAQLGAAGVRAGLRWGGGAPVDDGGIPVAPEMWHFDLGPRSSSSSS